MIIISSLLLLKKTQEKTASKINFVSKISAILLDYICVNSIFLDFVGSCLKTTKLKLFWFK